MSYVLKAGNVVERVKLLDDDTTATGAGDARPVYNYTTLRFEVWGTGTFAVSIEAVADSGTARELTVWDLANNEFLADNSIVAAGFYECDVQAFINVQANVTAISGGNVNVAGGLIG